MEVREGPMHQVEVQIAESEIRERLSTGSDDVIFAMFVIPQLRSDPQFPAFKIPSQALLDCISNLVFVGVHRCTIEVPIPNRRRIFHRRRNLTGRDMVRSEGSQTDSWHPRTGIQSPLGYESWIDIPVNQWS